MRSNRGNGGGFPGSPFDGPLGSGIHGSFNITGATTATEVLYHATDFTIDNATYTVKQQNPGGIFIACRGRFKMTSGAILDANGRGGLGGLAQVTDVNNGRNGQWGRNWGSGGGAGGGDGTRTGGDGAGCLTAPISRDSLYDTLTGVGVGYGGNSGYNGVASLSGDPLLQTLTPVTGRGTGTGVAGIAVHSSYTAFFDAKLISDLFQLIGYGGGGGSGARNATSNSGAGGKGGGFILIVCNELDFQSGATIRAAGSAGSNAAGATAAGGGGGGGGVIVILYRTLIVNGGTLTVSGGAAGTGNGTNDGGAGAAGYSNVAVYRW